MNTYGSGDGSVRQSRGSRSRFMGDASPMKGRSFQTEREIFVSKKKEITEASL